MSTVTTSGGGTWRPSLEELTPEALVSLARETGAECRRRALVLDEHLDERLRQYEFSLYQREDAARTMVQREHDAQEAERLMTLWAERADALNKGGEAAPAPVPLGPMVDKLVAAILQLPEANVLKYQLRPDAPATTMYAVANALSEARKVMAKRKAPVSEDPGPLNDGLGMPLRWRDPVPGL